MESIHITTFWKLIHKNNITIPIIQRDYAQGRKGKENLRETFIRDLLNALQNKKTLTLDFVYGYENKDVFTPLDGQQRLTTLFLLHWYIGNIENKDINKLYHFSYRTRTSSKDFCSELVINSIKIPESNNESSSLSSIIQNQTWFFNKWIQDPTVLSMLNTLDTIHSIIKTDKKLWTRLTENNYIQFQLIKMNNFHLGDELYIKMNHRGKPLSTWEGFKARFEKIIISKKIDIQYFKNNIDGKWLNCFWKAYTAKHSDVLLSFFERVLTNELILLKDNEEKTSYLLKNNDCILKEAEESKLSFELLLPKISSVLDHLSSEKQNTYQYLENNDLKKLDLFCDQSFKNYENNYEYRLKFYALFEILSQNKSNINDWIRVTFNLIENNYYDKPSDFSKTLNGLKSIIYTDYDDVFNFLTKEPNLAGFRKTQIEEEILKAKLRKLYHIDIDIIENDNSYFKGEIYSLLKLSKIIDETGVIDSNQDVRLAEVSKIFKLLFQNTKEHKFGVHNFAGNFYFERALLSLDKNYYPYKFKSTRSFLLENHRDLSWKRFMRNKEVINDESFIQLFDLLTEVNLENDLKNSINIKENKEFNNFLKEPKLFNNLKNLRLTKNVSNNGYSKKVILHKTNINGNGIDVKSLFLLKNQIEDPNKENTTKDIFLPFSTCKYHIRPINKNEGCTYLDWKIDTENQYALDIFHKGMKDNTEFFELKFFSRKQNCSIPEDIIRILKQIGFKSDEHTTFSIIINNEKELIPFLIKLCNELNKYTA